MQPNASILATADVAVVGAGPAGLMAAIAAAKAGKSVAVVEQLDKPGVKLLATGGGRCNLTNTLQADAFMKRFGRQGRFMQPALAKLDPQALRSFFRGLGVETVAHGGMLVYPSSQSARTVQEALLRQCESLGVRMLVGTRVDGLRIDAPPAAGAASAVAGLRTDRGDVRAGRIILATGGKSYPEMGATGAGYELARQAGHSIVEPIPALVPLKTQEAWPGQLSGLSLAAVRIRIDVKGQSKAGLTGDVLLTHGGLSGPAVLDVSGDVTALLKTQPVVPILLDLTPGTSQRQWLERFAKWRTACGRRSIHSLLGEHLPIRLADVLCMLAGLDGQTRAAHLGVAQPAALAEMLTALPLHVTASAGFEQAMVTRGGVSLRQVHPGTLESKLVGGLYFAGELLDLDGPCGGFNLQWAFSSGLLAGESAASDREAGGP